MIELGFWALVAVCLWGLTTLGMQLHYPLVRPLIFKFSPAGSSLLIFLYALSPLAISLAMTLMHSASLGYLMTFDHCHGDCAPHSLAASQSVSALGLVVLLGTIVLVAWRVKRAVTGSRMAAQLLHLADSGSDDFTDSDKDAPAPVPLLAANVGFLRPRVFISRVLSDGLSEEQLRSVALHEQAHSVRRDNLRLLLVGIVCGGRHPLSAGLLQDLQQITEMACDDYAGRKAGRLNVAEALVNTARLKRRIAASLESSHPRYSSLYPFDGQDLKGRVHRLLEAEKPGLPVAGFYPLGFLALVSIVLVLGHPLHCGIEFLLGQTF